MFPFQLIDWLIDTILYSFTQYIYIFFTDFISAFHSCEYSMRQCTSGNIITGVCIYIYTNIYIHSSILSSLQNQSYEIGSRQTTHRTDIYIKIFRNRISFEKQSYFQRISNDSFPETGSGFLPSAYHTDIYIQFNHSCGCPEL